MEDYKKEYLKVPYQNPEKVYDPNVVTAITYTNFTSRKLDASPDYKVWEENEKSSDISEDETISEFEGKALNCRLCLAAIEGHNSTSEFKGLSNYFPSINK